MEKSKELQSTKVRKVKVTRKKGMAKGTAGATETGSEYEQGAAGTNK